VVHCQESWLAFAPCPSCPASLAAVIVVQTVSKETGSDLVCPCRMRHILLWRRPRWPHRLDANQSEPSLNCRCLPVVVNHWLCATPRRPPAALRATACVPTCPSRMGVRDQQASASLSFTT